MFARGDTVRYAGQDGMAFVVRGPLLERDSDGVLEPVDGWLIITAVGDDYRVAAELSELTALAREEFCGQCGQVGCGHDGMEREDVGPGAYGIVAVDSDTPGAITCGTCGRSWAEDITPAGRCPWEYEHGEADR